MRWRALTIYNEINKVKPGHIIKFQNNKIIETSFWGTENVINESVFSDYVNTKKKLKNLINESVYEKFLFSDSEVEKKINVIFENSINFNENDYQKYFDLIFIDGGHTYSVIKNDTEKSFNMLNTNGIILWHDYVLGKESAKDVVKYLNAISKEKKIYHIKNTSLCFFKNNV